jgi:pimeloyl-ACP methyl ester carboxylesterase
MSTESTARAAASIDFAFVPRPAGLDPAVAAAPAGTLDFLSIKTLDGEAMNAGLWRPANRSAAETPLAVVIHGSGSNFGKLPNRALGQGLSALGYAALGINTRQHDEGVCRENFFHIRSDIEAAVYVARALGHRELVLLGHSLGNIQALFYAATSWAQDIKAIVLCGMFANLAWKSRHILTQNEDEFRALTDAAMKAVADGRPAEILPVAMGWMGMVRVPANAQHVLTYRVEETSASDGTFWIKRTPYPILMVRDEADGIILDFEPYMLLSAATSEGSLVQGIDYVKLANPRPPAPENHVFTHTHAQLVDTVGTWLAARKIR